MAHTPGPWTARPDSGQIVLNGANVYAVQEICNEQGGFNPDDIRLMAAAPELLECCRELLEIVEDEYANDRYPEELGSWKRGIDAATRALNKAEGGG